ncbi:MAG: hypothetical protein JWM91_450 [Rhodospirillales bacterium]|nr:hypothetical protein [Rhodospirillales bacterium]
MVSVMHGRIPAISQRLYGLVLAVSLMASLLPVHWSQAQNLVQNPGFEYSITQTLSPGRSLAGVDLT